MRGGELAIGVLYQVKIFNQPIADRGLAAKERLDLLKRAAVKLTPACEFPCFPFSRLRKCAARSFRHPMFLKPRPSHSLF
jgi:hypothetical protein